MVKFNNFWLDSITRKDLSEFLDKHYGRSEYVAHAIKTDIVTKKNYMIVHFETPYGDDSYEIFDAYGYHGRLDCNATIISHWRKMVASANAGRMFDGKTYEQNLNELLQLQNQQDLVH